MKNEFEYEGKKYQRYKGEWCYRGEIKPEMNDILDKLYKKPNATQRKKLILTGIQY